MQFAILRVGYRGYTEGAIQEDAYFEQNLEGAIDAGLDVGVYFFSQAIDEQEAREEARIVLDKISVYLLAYPVCICRACRRTRSGWLNTTIRRRLPITLTSGSILPPARSTALRATSI